MVEVNIPNIEKVPKKSTDELEKILRKLFPNEEEYARGRGISYEGEHNQIPYDNRIMTLKNGKAITTYSAFSQNGRFTVSLSIKNLSEDVLKILVKETEKSSPEVYSILKRKYS